MRTRAAITSVSLSLLFLIVYPLCNWITSLRSDVGTWYFAWERYIPFVPFFILPYMSIDLFFIAAPFLCREERELRVYAQRMAFAILFAGLCFLLFPLRFAFERPAVDGWLGAIFNTFRGLDHPYNLVPSMHIALRTILADIYARHTRGLARLASHVWFSLVGFSTVLTYQHHVMDVVTGFALAGVCFHLFREAASPPMVTRNPRIGAYYAAGAAACLAAAAVLRPWGGLLVWPALSLGITATAYFGAGPRIFRKNNGRLSLAARIILAPVLAGQWLSLYHYRRQCAPWDEVTPGVWMGRRLDDREAAEAVARGVTAVLDLCGEFSEAQPFLALSYRNLPIMDLTAPTREQLEEGVAFIQEHAAGGIVYVHCKIGYSRSAAVVGAYLMASGRAASPEESVALLRRARPAVVIRSEAMEALREFRTR
jgi:membrane-associated phospholipid phosphatase